MDSLSQKILKKAEEYSPLAREILAEAIRIPEDFLDRDPLCGLSNHEGPRLEYLKSKIQEIGAVFKKDDVFFDDFGNLVWILEDPKDPTPSQEKKIIYWDGHTDTVRALREQWREKIGEGMDAYKGLVDKGKINKDFLRRELGYLPPEEEWENLIFGRGSADQLGGVVSQIIASKILVELADEGALQGVKIYSYGTVTEEDNDGCGPMYLMRKELPGQPSDRIPHVVILTEGTGHAQEGALGIYRGQRGRMQIEVTVKGRSCHGSMPSEGLNPLEHGGRILAEAADAHEKGEGFLDHPFLGKGTRTASWAHLETPSDCAVPEVFIFRFDRRLTVGETPEQALLDIENLSSVKKAREAGLEVNISVPYYDQPTWRGYRLGNPQIYLGWETPEDHPVIQAAAKTYQNTVSHLAPSKEKDGSLRKHPRISRWIFSTDGVGFPVNKKKSGLTVPEDKTWIEVGDIHHPPMFGIGPGIEQNTHKIGEAMDLRELVGAVAFLAAYPQYFRSC